MLGTLACRINVFGILQLYLHEETSWAVLKIKVAYFASSNNLLHWKLLGEKDAKNKFLYLMAY